MNSRRVLIVKSVNLIKDIQFRSANACSALNSSHHITRSLGDGFKAEWDDVNTLDY